MGLVLFVIVFVMIFLAFLGIVFMLVHWCTHREMVIEDGRPWNYANFETFFKEFSKRTWQKNSEWKDSLFSVAGEQDGYIHAGIIRFSETGMVLYPWSYVRYTLWKQSLLQNMKRNKDLWKG